MRPGHVQCIQGDAEGELVVRGHAVRWLVDVEEWGWGRDCGGV